MYSSIHPSQIESSAGGCCSFPGTMQHPFVNGSFQNENTKRNIFSWLQKQQNPILETNVSKQKPSSLPPSQDPSPEATDVLIAKELNGLSLQDRERIFEEIHGVGNDDQMEDLADIELKLSQMEAEIEKIPHKPVYIQAKLQNSDYVSNEKFRLKFLRAEMGDPKEAAARLVGFFEFKLELFGSEKLTKEIGIDDFLNSPEEKRALEAGLFQCLPDRDRSGRLIVGKFHQLDFLDISLESKLRVFWFMLMTAAENEEDQKRGIVLLVFNMDGIMNRVETWKNSTLLATLPVRVNAFHVCHNDPKISILNSLCMLAAGPYYRARMRVHEGTLLECVYKLHTFGISSRSLPFRYKIDEMDLSALKNWIVARKEFEDSNLPQTNKSLSDFVATPTEFDVLFGRGKACQNHSGNIRLRQLIDSNRDNYEQAKLLEKTVISERIVRAVKDLSGRFLKQSQGIWVEVDDEIARDKISHTFRDQRRKLKQTQHGKVL